MSMGTPITGPPQSGLPYYVWEVPGKLISIQLHFDVVDRMLQEVMRGFGSLPRRGRRVADWHVLGQWFQAQDHD